MEAFFAHRIFDEDLFFWRYLEALKDFKFDCADGFYFGQLHLVHWKLELEYMKYFSNEKEYLHYAQNLPNRHTSFGIEIKGGMPRYFFCGSETISGGGEKSAEGIWTLDFSDWFEEGRFQKNKFTIDEIRAACAELAKILVVHGKKS